MKLTDNQLKQMFTYQKPDEDRIRRHAEIGGAAAAFAVALMEHAPDCLDRDKAMECLRAARMWANSAIALEGKVGWPLEPQVTIGRRPEVTHHGSGPDD